MSSTTDFSSIKPISSDVQLQAAEFRHSYYGLSDKSTISDEKIREIVYGAVKHVPTAFNNQTTAAAVVLGGKHKELWNTVKRTLQDKYGAENETTNRAYVGVVDSSALKAYGTVLFFIDTDIVEGADNNPHLAPFKGQFKVWAEQSTGMLQYVVWSALEGEGLGASLQHHSYYAEETNNALTEFAGVPKSWKVTAIMPFGAPVAGPGGPRPRTYDNLDKRVRVIQ